MHMCDLIFQYIFARFGNNDDRMSGPVKNKHQIIEQLFHDHYQQLFYYAYDLTKDEEASKDLVNEAFVLLLEKMDELKDIRLDGYLFVSIRNRCLSYLEKQRRDDRYRDYCLTVLTEEDDDYWMTMDERIKEMSNVIESMPVFFGVHSADDFIGYSAGNHCFTLIVIQSVHLGNLIINVPRIVFDPAFQHISHQPDTAFPAALFQKARGFPHGLPVHFHQTFSEILHSGHLSNSFLTR